MERKVYSSVPNLLVYQLSMYDELDSHSLDSQWTFIGIDHEDVFSKVLDELATQWTEITGETIVPETHQERFERMYDNHEGISIKGYHFVIDCIPIDDVTY